MLRILQATLVVFIVVGSALVGWWLLSLDTDTSETQTRAQMTRLEVSARAYYRQMGEYDGVCADIGLPATYRCHESSTAYAIEAPLLGGKYLCLDSTGFFGNTLISKGERIACRRY